MTQPNDPPDATPDGAGRRPGERLAKAIARAGLGSRREAEAWIEQGRVAVNGETVASAAVNVTGDDRVEVDGRPLPARERTRLWLYHKPRGYVTTTHDPEGRETVFSVLPPELPRVMTIGRLDINTEGLLLLTNDGGLARVLELPETGWLRRYRVRAFGRPEPDALEALKDGVTIDGFAYGAIEAEVERQKNDNVWLKFGLREGKNREVKRLAEHLGLSVNRLIRISFGPFQLGDLAEGGVEEVRSRTLVEQLGRRLTEEAGCDFETPEAAPRGDEPRKTGGRGAGRATAGASPVRTERSRAADPSQRIGRRAPIARPRDMAAPTVAVPSTAKDAAGDKRTRRAQPIADRQGRAVKVERVARTALEAEAAPKRFRKHDAGAAERFGAPGRPPRPPRADKAAGSAGERPRRPARSSPETEALLSWDRPKGPGAPRTGPRADGGRPARAPRGERPSGDRPRGDRPVGDRPRGSRPPGDRPFEDKPRGPRPVGGRPERSFSDRPRQDRPTPDRARPSGDRPQRDASERPADERADRPRVSAPRWRDDVAGAGRPARSEGGDRPARSGPPRGRPEGERPGGDRPARAAPARRTGEGRGEGAPRRDKPAGDRPRGDRSADGAREGRPTGPRAFGGKAGAKPGGASGGRPAGAGGKPRAGGRPGGAPGGFKPRGSGGGGKGGGAKGGGGGRGRPGGADRRR